MSTRLFLEGDGKGEGEGMDLDGQSERAKGGGKKKAFSCGAAELGSDTIACLH